LGRDRCGWSRKESYSARVLGLYRASRLQRCERHRRVAPVEFGIERCAMVQDARSVAATQRSKREHFLIAGRASASKYVSSPTKRLVGVLFVSRVAGVVRFLYQ